MSFQDMALDLIKHLKLLNKLIIIIFIKIYLINKQQKNALDIAKFEKEAILQTYENNKDKAENPIERETLHDLPDVYGLESLADHASDKDRPLPGLAGSINILARRYTSKIT